MSEKCNRCQVEHDSLRCLECPQCEAVSKVLAMVFANWLPDEIVDLSGALRKQSLHESVQEFRAKGAGLTVRLCKLIGTLGSRLPLGADHLKTKVCDALLKHDAYEKKFRGWLQDQGKTWQEGRAIAANKIGETISEITKRSPPDKRSVPEEL